MIPDIMALCDPNSLADVINIGIIALKTDKSVALWNRWMERASGIKAEDAIGRTLEKLFPDLAASRLAAAIAGALANKMSAVVSPALNESVLALFTSPGEHERDQRMSLHVTVFPLFAEGVVSGCLLQVSDVTASVRREHLLRERVTALREAQVKLDQQARDLAAINKELEQFAYVASHDMRQPLRTMIGLLRNIEMNVGEALDEDLKGDFALVINGAKRLDRLIIDLLEYSRVGRHEKAFVPVPLSEVINDCIVTLRDVIEDAGAVISVQSDFPQVLGNRSELFRFFSNLIGNAVKYRAPGRVPRIEIGWAEAGADWLLWVRDNGIGMPGDSLERAFEIFQRLVSQDAYEGSGIGLAICEKVAHLHGGKIWAESTLGEGSTFKVTLPRMV